MAPSQALHQCTTSFRRSQAPRLLAACRKRNKPSSPLTIHHVPHMNTSLGLPSPLAACMRMYSQASSTPQPPDYLSEGELEIFNKIKAELDPIRLEVQDISGGCGSMYALDIESSKFKGLTVIKQHKLVNQILANEIKKWHGVQLKTRASWPKKLAASWWCAWWAHQPFRKISPPSFMNYSMASNGASAPCHFSVP